MDGKKRCLNYLRKERQFVKAEICRALSAQQFRLVRMEITDDGYVVDAVPLISCDGEISHEEVFMRVDQLEFCDYILTDITFSEKSMSFVLTPVTYDAMDRFVWNYIACYFPFVDELESLSIAIGVLERMIEPLSGVAKDELERYTSAVIQ